MSKPQIWILVVVVAVALLGGVGWLAYTRPSDGSTAVQLPSAPDANAALQPVPGQETTQTGGSGQPAAMDATGAAVIR